MRRSRLVAAIAASLVLFPLVPAAPAMAMTRRELPPEIRRELPVRVQKLSSRSKRLLARKQQSSAAAMAARIRPSVRTTVVKTQVRSQVQTSSASSAGSNSSSAPGSSSSSSAQAIPEPRVFQVPSDPIKREVLRLVNEARAKQGLEALSNNGMLEASAQRYAEDMLRREFFGHRDPEGRSSHERIRDGGYVQTPCDCIWRTGENLAKGQKTAKQVVQDWMNSPSHRENIMHPDFQEIGIGIAGEYWVEHFGSLQPN